MPPKLAPSAVRPIRTSVTAPRVLLTDSDWTTLYPEIEQLYIQERRKLRYIIQYIEAKYGLKATQQMYKKRFAKWGIQKNPRRLAKSERSSTRTVRDDSSSSNDPHSVPVSPEFGGNDGSMLMMLTSVQTWNTSFYELAGSSAEGSLSIHDSWPERYHDMNFTFKLMIDMLDRGHGDLAGRVARKAFLLAEETLMLAGPALLWNILEIMYFMLKSRHLQMFQLLLAHVKALVDVRMSRFHPLSSILRALSAFMASSPSPTPAPRDTQTTSPPRPLLDDKVLQAIDAKTQISCNILLFMIEQAWKLNAEILFQNFDHGLFQLYLRVHWDTCSIEPPAAIVAAARQWISDISPQNLSGTPSEKSLDHYIQITPFGKDKMLQSLLVAPENSALPEDYEMQWIHSTEILRDHAVSILSKISSSNGESATLLRILATLVTAKVLEEWSATTQNSGTNEEISSMLTRGQAGTTACALRTTMYLDADKYGAETYLSTAAQIRSIIELREYAKSGTDPRIVVEMLLLGDVFAAAGDHRKASQVKQTAFQRLEQYIQDIPPDLI